MNHHVVSICIENFLLLMTKQLCSRDIVLKYLNTIVPELLPLTTQDRQELTIKLSSQSLKHSHKHRNVGVPQFRVRFRSC